MKDNEASVPENLSAEWIRLMKGRALLMLGWTACSPSGNSNATGLYRCYLPLIADFWAEFSLGL
jgi:hypothetical protein